MFYGRWETLFFKVVESYRKNSWKSINGGVKMSSELDIRFFTVKIVQNDKLIK